MAATLQVPRDRETAHQWIDIAPAGSTITFKRPGRSLDQNAQMWVWLTKISQRAEHNGQRYTPEQWKCLFMHACGHEIGFLQGLNGEPFPAGFRSSRLTKEQMSDLLEFIVAWCAKRGIYFDD